MGGYSYWWILSAGQGGRWKKYQPHPSLTFQAPSGNPCSPNVTGGVQARDPTGCNLGGWAWSGTNQGRDEWRVDLEEVEKIFGEVEKGEYQLITSANTHTILDRHCSIRFVCTKWILSSQKHLRVELSLSLPYWEETQVKPSQTLCSCSEKFSTQH